jgi:hypothetical protein
MDNKFITCSISWSDKNINILFPLVKVIIRQGCWKQQPFSFLKVCEPKTYVHHNYSIEFV